MTPPTRPHYATKKGPVKLYFDVESTELTKPIRLHARTAVVEPMSELMKELGKLFGRKAVVLESEA